MNFLEERIAKDGIVKEGNILKVDSFLNHQMDIDLFNEMGYDTIIYDNRGHGENVPRIATMGYMEAIKIKHPLSGLY